MLVAQRIAVLLAGLAIFVFSGRLARWRERMRQSLNSQSPIPLSTGPSTTFYTWMLRIAGIILVLAAIAGLVKNFVK